MFTNLVVITKNVTLSSFARFIRQKLANS